jgi:hypothetical protein
MNMPRCKAAIIFNALSAQALHKNFAPGLEAQVGNATLLAETLQLETPLISIIRSRPHRAGSSKSAVTLQVQVDSSFGVDPPQVHLQVLLTTVAEVAYFTMMTADNACKTNLK